MDSVNPQSPRRPAFRWTLPRVLLAGAVFIAPFALLALKLHLEMASGANPAQGPAMLIRFVVVGLLACLLTKCCVDWMRKRR